jgi:amidophosphoribosyltransferase
MVDATKQERSRLCTACFTGDYPVELPDESLLGKHLLEATLASPTLGKALPVLNNP